jgi:hypothetical protein
MPLFANKLFAAMATEFRLHSHGPALPRFLLGQIGKGLENYSRWAQIRTAALSVAIGNFLDGQGGCECSKRDDSPERVIRGRPGPRC